MSPRRQTQTWQRYAQFIRTPPELSVAWHDNETGARAWLVINSLRGGAAGGGTRMRLGLDPREVIYLAKAMELKFSICGPPIGGAKNGIDTASGRSRGSTCTLGVRQVGARPTRRPSARTT